MKVTITTKIIIILPTCSNGTMSSSRTDWKSPPDWYQNQFNLCLAIYMYVSIIVLYEPFLEGFRFLIPSFQPTHPPNPKSKFSLNTMVGHADADAMPIRNMRRIYCALSDICPHGQPYSPGAYSRTSTISYWFWNTSFRWTILLESETKDMEEVFITNITMIRKDVLLLG